MKIGDYVRNKYGIAKIIDIKTNDEGIDICYFDNDIAFIFDTKLKEEKYRTHILPLANNVDINKIKHSPNIIDLIEVGDYVNGKKVEWIGYGMYQDTEDGLIGIGDKFILFNEFTREGAREKDIKSILTKEQFESMEYKL